MKHFLAVLALATMFSATVQAAPVPVKNANPHVELLVTARTDNWIQVDLWCHIPQEYGGFILGPCTDDVDQPTYAYAWWNAGTPTNDHPTSSPQVVVKSTTVQNRFFVNVAPNGAVKKGQYMVGVGRTGTADLEWEVQVYILRNN